MPSARERDLVDASLEPDSPALLRRHSHRQLRSRFFQVGSARAEGLCLPDAKTSSSLLQTQTVPKTSRRKGLPTLPPAIPFTSIITATRSVRRTRRVRRPSLAPQPFQIVLDLVASERFEGGEGFAHDVVPAGHDRVLHRVGGQALGLSVIGSTQDQCQTIERRKAVLVRATHGLTK